MLVENQKVTIKWHPSNKSKYIALGYKFTKMGDCFDVPVELLTKGNKSMVRVRCDCCGIEHTKKFVDHIRHGDNCPKCSAKQRVETNKEKYGVEYFVQAKQFKQQREEKMLEKYGTIHALQVDECKDKFKATCLKNNGTEYPMQSHNIQEKSKQTCLDKFGVEYSFQSDEIKQKSYNTCMEKYGYANTALVPSIRAKQRQSLYVNGDIATSKPERETVELLKDIYGADNCFPQYPTQFYNLDCLVVVNETKIDVEYDGQWIHSKRTSFDERRDNYHISHGYKVLRIKGNSKIPTKEQLVDAIEYLLTNEANYFEFSV